MTSESRFQQVKTTLNVRSLLKSKFSRKEPAENYVQEKLSYKNLNTAQSIATDKHQKTAPQAIVDSHSKITASGSLDKKETIQIAQLDLSQYRHGNEVAQRVSELLSAPDAIRTFIWTTIGISVFTVILYSLAANILADPQASTIAGNFLDWFVWIAGNIYTLLVGIILGALLGILRVLHKSMRNIESILQILLDLTGQAAKDYKSLQSGALIMPSAGEFVEKVYDEVLSPIIEDVISSSVILVGRPIIWVYRWTIDRAIRFLIARVPLSTDVEDHIMEMATSTFEDAEDFHAEITRFTNLASGTISIIGRATRFYSLLPLYIVTTIVLLLVLIPLVTLVYRYFG